jgi:hypothetical protein
MSNVTPLEIAGIVARAFDLPLQALATRLCGRHGEWPIPLKARAVAARLMRTHTMASYATMARMFGLETRSPTPRFVAMADKLTQELHIDPDLHGLIARCEIEIDKLHEARETARDAAERRREFNHEATDVR